MRLCSLASGSSGNCVYVGSDTTHVLVDAGVSGKRTEAALNELGISAADLDAVFVTHEHGDHIGSLGVLARRHAVPIYATAGTLAAIRGQDLGVIDDSLFHEIRPDERVIVKDIAAIPMRISHDAAEPVAYRFRHGHVQVAIITDLGCFNDYIIDSLRGVDALFLEANHDVNMLLVGNYPYFLKQRIMSDRGHLSNELAGELLGRIMHDQLKAVLLGHLSQHNNMPELAYETVRLALNTGGHGRRPGEFPMMVAPRHGLSPVLQV